MERQKSPLAKYAETLQAEANRASFEQVKQIQADRYQMEKKKEEKSCHT